MAIAFLSDILFWPVAVENVLTFLFCTSEGHGEGNESYSKNSSPTKVRNLEKTEIPWSSLCFSFGSFVYQAHCSEECLCFSFVSHISRTCLSHRVRNLENHSTSVKWPLPFFQIFYFDPLQWRMSTYFFSARRRGTVREMDNIPRTRPPQKSEIWKKLKFREVAFAVLLDLLFIKPNAVKNAYAFLFY